MTYYPPPEDWVAVRHIRFSQQCELCFERIPSGAPAGPREMAKGFYQPLRKAWACPGCHTERQRAYEAGRPK